MLFPGLGHCCGSNGKTSARFEHYEFVYDFTIKRDASGSYYAISSRNSYPYSVTAG